jgi:hypothetical protein
MAAPQLVVPVGVVKSGVTLVTPTAFATKLEGHIDCVMLGATKAELI